jgi:PKHD-type hydroxylase
MKGEWCYFKSYLSPQFCQNLINDALQIQEQKGAIGQGTEAQIGVDESYRRSIVRFINKGEHNGRYDYIFDFLWKTGLLANDDFFHFNITRLNFVQFTEYKDTYKGEYKEHHDVFWTADPVYHRKMSAVVQLSDPNTYEGGNFEIVEGCAKPPVEDVRAQGTILYMPSMFRHQVTPVTKGTRYSLVAWFEGKHWT